MAINMMATGLMIKHQEKENFIIIMVIIMKGTGSIIKLLVMEFILVQMEISTKESGMMICNVEPEEKAGLMVRFLKGSIKMVWNMEQDITNGVTKVNFWVKLNIINFPVKENIFGPTVTIITGTGGKVIWTVTEFLNTKMEITTKVNL